MNVAGSIDALLTRALGPRLVVVKALDPQNPADYAKIVLNLQNALKGMTGPAEAKALKAALETLDVDWTAITAKQKAKVLEAAKVAVNPGALVLPKVQAKITETGYDVAGATKKGTKEKYGLSISPDLSAVDQKILESVAYSQGNFIKDEYGKRADAFGLLAKKIVADGLAKGKGRIDIGKDLREQLTAQGVNRSQAYWNVIASAFTARARSYAALASYQEGGIYGFTFDSVLDARTSQVCRFMHGKRFPVARAIERFHMTESDGDPEAVKDFQPWVRHTGGQLWIPGGDGKKVTVADVVKPGVGNNAIGDHANAMDDGRLAANGIMVPPLHGHCRSTLQPDFDAPPPAVAQVPFALTPSPSSLPPPPPDEGPGYIAPPEEQEGFVFGPGGIEMQPIAIKPDPVAPPVVVYKPTAAELKGKALDQLAYESEGQSKAYLSPHVDESPSSKNDVDAAVLAADDAYSSMGTSAAWKKQQKEIKKLVYDELSVKSPASVKALILSPKELKKAEIIAVKTGKKITGLDGKKQDEIIVVAGHEAVEAHAFLGTKKIQIQVLDAKEWAKEKAAKAAKAKEEAEEEEKKAAAAQAAAAMHDAAAKLPPPTKDTPPPPPEVILHQQIGPQGGSNPGGLYRGSDGVDRYVKFYSNVAQAQSEAMANKLYRQLGLDAPAAITWKMPDGRLAYASPILEGTTFDKMGTIKQEDARKFYKGFAADVLMGNWDAAGMSCDNIMLLKGGGVARIDNGAAFLFRAQGTRKPGAVLDAVTELETFFPGGSVSNPGFHKMAKAAGYTSIKDFKADFSAGVKQIEALHKRHGSWAAFVDSQGADIDPADRARIAQMLEARMKAMQNIVTKWEAPKVPRGADPDLSGLKWLGSHVKGSKPSEDLKVEDLPEFEIPKDWGEVVKEGDYAKYPTVKKLPSGESRADYEKRVAAMLENVTKNAPDCRSSIRNFAGSAYGDIRQYERRIGLSPTGTTTDKDGQRDSDSIQKLYLHGKAEPMTTFRGGSFSRKVVDSWIQNEGKIGLNWDNTGGTTSSSWSIRVALNGFMHGQTDPTGDNLKVLFKINQKSAVPIEASGYTSFLDSSSEGEVLIGRDAMFRVRNVARMKGKKKIVIIEIDEI